MGIVMFSVEKINLAILLWQLAISALGNVINLRIMPLGDSITWGEGSSDKNGYRLDLQNSLKLSGYSVEYIGSQQSGSMPDNHNEGHRGAIVTQIAVFANLTLKQLPNVVLLMAGSNDMNSPVDPSTAPARLGALIDQVLAAVPGVVIVVALLTPSTIKATQANIVAYNAAIPSIVATRAKSSKKVMTVNMSKSVTTSDLVDTLHPGDGGYAKMASVWFAGIQQASSNGWISVPGNVTIALTSSLSSSTTVTSSPASTATVTMLPTSTVAGNPENPSETRPVKSGCEKGLNIKSDIVGSILVMWWLSLV